MCGWGGETSSVGELMKYRRTFYISLSGDICVVIAAFKQFVMRVRSVLLPYSQEAHASL